MADSTTMEFEAQYGEKLQQLMDLLNADKIHVIKFKPEMVGGTFGGASMWRASSNYSGRPPANSNIPGVGSPSTYNNLNVLFMRESLKYFKLFPGATKALGNFSSTLEGMMDNLFKMTRGGLGVVGGAAGLAAGAAAFTLERAGSFRDKAAQAAGIGATPYTPEAFVNNLKMETGGEAGVQALFGGLVQQQTTIGGPAYLRNFLNRFGVKTTGKETQEELAVDVLRAERKMATTVDRQFWQKYADIFKVGNVVDINTMMRLKNTPQGQFDKDIGDALKESKGGAEGKNLIELQKEWNNNLIDLGKRMDRVADAIAGWILAFKTQIPPGEGGIWKKFGEGTLKDLIIPFMKLQDKSWLDIFKSIFGISPAKAGELPAGIDAAAAAKVPDNIQDIRDILARDAINAGTILAGGDGAGDFPGRVGRPSTGRVTGGGGRSAAIGNLGVRGFWTPEKEKIADDELIKQGATPDAALGLISRWRYVEASGGPTSMNPNGAFGIAQWLTPSRRRGIAGDTDFLHQLQYVGKEWRGDEVISGRLARTAIGDQQGAEAASAYERAEGYSPGSHRDLYTARTQAGIAQVRKDLESLKAIKKADGAAADATKDKVKKADGAPPAGFHYHDPQKPIFDYPSPTEKSGKQSLNDLNLFQMEKGVRVSVNNPAGASVTVQSVMLGGLKGSYS